jgi:phage gp46-like protein
VFLCSNNALVANDDVSMAVVVDVRTDVVGEPAYWIDNVERPSLVRTPAVSADNTRS